MWIKVDNDAIVHINAAMVTEIKPLDGHKVEVTLACGTKHKLDMDCSEFLQACRCGFVHEHDE